MCDSNECSKVTSGVSLNLKLKTFTCEIIKHFNLDRIQGEIHLAYLTVLKVSWLFLSWGRNMLYELCLRYTGHYVKTASVFPPSVGIRYLCIGV